jgi:hypothetical protein
MQWLRHLRELRQEVRQIMSEQSQVIRQMHAEIVAQPQPPTTPETPVAAALNGREYIQLSERMRLLNSELVRVYEALAKLCTPDDDLLAITYMKQALGLTCDPVAAAEGHYALACLLAPGPTRRARRR